MYVCIHVCIYVSVVSLFAQLKLWLVIVCLVITSINTYVSWILWGRKSGMLALTTGIQCLPLKKVALVLPLCVFSTRNAWNTLIIRITYLCAASNIMKTASTYLMRHFHKECYVSVFLEALPLSMCLPRHCCNECSLYVLGCSEFDTYTYLCSSLGSLITKAAPPFLGGGGIIMSTVSIHEVPQAICLWMLRYVYFVCMSELTPTKNAVSILSRVRVSVEGVRIDDCIYWTILQLVTTPHTSQPKTVLCSQSRCFVATPNDGCSASGSGDQADDHLTPTSFPACFSW
jgi:hypothetical protein